MDEIQCALVRHVAEFVDRPHDGGYGLMIGCVIQHQNRPGAVGLGRPVGRFGQLHGGEFGVGQRVRIGLG